MRRFAGRTISPIALVLVLSHCREPTTTQPVPRPDRARPRIVTLAPNISEIVAYVGCSSAIVGRDDFSDFPAHLREIPKVGGVQPSIEAIVALAPDLVIGSTEGAHPRLVSALSRTGIDARLLRTNRLVEITGALRQAAKWLSVCANPAAVATFESALESQRRSRKRRASILFVVWPNPLYVAGRKTFLDDLIELTGGVNAVERGVEGWPQYSQEKLILSPPDLVLYPSKSVSLAQVQSILMRSRSPRTVFASVDEDQFTRPGPRLVEAAGELNRILDEWERLR